MRTQHGFSLLEMAIVIALMGLIAGAGLSMASALRINNGIAATRTKQQAIKEALITFIARNRRLPCPAIETLPPGVGYGVESGVPGNCGATPIPLPDPDDLIHRGVVPWVSLGLPDADALDGWNNRFSYFVVEAVTANPKPEAPLSGMRGRIALHSGTPVALGLATSGQPNNQINACSTTPGDNGCNLAAVAVILSHGMNGSSAFMPNGTQRPPPVATAVLELANLDTADLSFVQTQYSDNADNPFDDLLLAMTPADLLGPLERSNAMPSALAITNDRIERLRESLIAHIVNGANGPGTIPPTGSALVPESAPVELLDGWGTALEYVQVETGVTGVCGVAADPIAFRITSKNMDLPNPADDLVFAQSRDQLKTLILAQGRPCG